MIERYTIKFAPAVSQKELEKALHAPIFSSDKSTLEPGEQLIVDKVTSSLHKMKARIEIVADFDDLKKIIALVKTIASDK